jgi:hypothetical protein
VLFTCGMVYLMGTRYAPETLSVWIQMFTHGYGFRILPMTFVMSHGYLLYMLQTRPVTISREEGAITISEY